MFGMVAVGFCSYWGSCCCCGCWFDGCCCCCFRVLLHNAGIIISTLPWRCAGILQIVIVSLPVIQGRAGLRLPGQSPCVSMRGFFPYLVLTSFWTSFFFLYQNPSCSIQTRKKGLLRVFVCGRQQYPRKKARWKPAFRWNSIKNE